MKLCVMMLDRHRTRMALIHENNHVPYGRRYVEVPLTPERREIERFLWDCRPLLNAERKQA